MMLPAKRSKKFLGSAKDFEMVAFIMEKHLSKWGMPSEKSKQFAEKYFEEMIDKVISGEVRVVLPHNLGYLQVLEHQYSGRSKEHIMKFGNLDYSLIWQRHPMFVYHRIKASKELNEKIRQKKLEGTKYLTEYVDGDTYVV